MLRGLEVLVGAVGSNLSVLERAASRDAQYVDRAAHCKAIARLTGLPLLRNLEHKNIYNDAKTSKNI